MFFDLLPAGISVYSGIMMSNNSLVNDNDFPLKNRLGKTIDFEEVLNRDILDLLGFDGNTPQEKKAELYEKMINTIQNRLMMRILDRLSDEEVKEFNELPEDSQVINDFFQSKNIDAAQMLAQEALIYKSELVSLTTYKYPE